MVKPAKNTICLWYDGAAEDVARFYAKTFPDSSVGAVHRAPGDFPSGKKGDVLTVDFTVLGVGCLGLNGGPAFKHSEAFSFQAQEHDLPLVRGAAEDAARFTPRPFPIRPSARAARRATIRRAKTT